VHQLQLVGLSAGLAGAHQREPILTLPSRRTVMCELYLPGVVLYRASFIRARPGPDVVGEILTPQGRAVASRGADCESR
jgi:hypothetical protein